MKNRTFTDEQRKEIMRKVEELRSQGLSQKEACVQADIHSSVYYSWVKKERRAQGAYQYPPKRKSPTPKPKPEPALIPLNPPKSEKIIALIGPAREVLEAIRSLQ